MGPGADARLFVVGAVAIMLRYLVCDGQQLCRCSSAWPASSAGLYTATKWR